MTIDLDAYRKIPERATFLTQYLKKLHEDGLMPNGISNLELCTVIIDDLPLVKKVIEAMQGGEQHV